MDVVFEVCMKLLQTIIFCEDSFELKIRIKNNLLVFNLCSAFCQSHIKKEKLKARKIFKGL